MSIQEKIALMFALLNATFFIVMNVIKAPRLICAINLIGMIGSAFVFIFG